MAKFMLIINESGFPIYTAPLEEPSDVDQFLLSGFLSAIHSFSKEISSGELSSLGLGNFHMNLLSKDGLLFVCAHDESIPEKVVRRLLEEISQKFLDQFKDYLSQGQRIDLSLFLEFNADFHAVLKKYKQLVDLPIFYGDIKSFRGLEKEIFAHCDGTRTIGEIAEELGKVYFDVMRTIVTQMEKSIKIVTKSRWVLE